MQDSLFEETTNLSTESQQIGPKKTQAISTRDESHNSLFEESVNWQTTNQQIEPNQTTTVSTRDESKDSLFEETASRASIPPNLAQMDTKSQQKYVDSLINPATAHTIARRNKKTQDRSHDSLLEITSDETSITTDQSNKDSRQEYMDSIAKPAITKTTADEKENTISTSDPKGLAGEEIEGKGNSKNKNIGFVNYKWTEILVEDDEECNSINPDEVK